MQAIIIDKTISKANIMKKHRDKNQYWADGELAPIDCQFVIKCGHLKKHQFIAFVRSMKQKSERIYYRHNNGHDSGEYKQEEQSITLAFKDKQQRDFNANMLKYQADKNGYKNKLKN